MSSPCRGGDLHGFPLLVFPEHLRGDACAALGGESVPVPGFSLGEVISKGYGALRMVGKSGLVIRLRSVN